MWDYKGKHTKPMQFCDVFFQELIAIMPRLVYNNTYVDWSIHRERKK